MGNTKNALSVWDFTLSVRKSTDDHKEIIKELEQIAKKFVFQKEDSTLEAEDAEDDDSQYSFDEDDEEELSEHYSCDEDDDGSQLGNYVMCDGQVSDEEPDFDSESSEYDSESEDSEEEDGGYIHWQGKISLIKRKRLSELVSLCKINNLYLSRAHWSPSANNGLGSVFYVQKLDTRVAGPWCDTDEREIPMPRQLAHIKELRSWQQEIVDRSQYNWNSRTVNWLYDPTGNSGKSSLVLWCKVKRIMNCRMVPVLLNSSFLDLNAAVMSQPVGGLYFVDMPRALKKSQITEFMAFIEALKTGHVFDVRYTYRERIFSSPSVWVMANALPDRSTLSKDRLVIWSIRDDEELVLHPSMQKSTERIKYPLTEVEREHVGEYWEYWRKEYVGSTDDPADTEGVPSSDNCDDEDRITL